MQRGETYLCVNKIKREMLFWLTQNSMYLSRTLFHDKFGKQENIKLSMFAFFPFVKSLEVFSLHRWVMDEATVNVRCQQSLGLDWRIRAAVTWLSLWHHSDRTVEHTGKKQTCNFKMQWNERTGEYWDHLWFSLYGPVQVTLEGQRSQRTIISSDQMPEKCQISLAWAS